MPQDVQYKKIYFIYFRQNYLLRRIRHIAEFLLNEIK